MRWVWLIGSIAVIIGSIVWVGRTRHYYQGALAELQEISAQNEYGTSPYGIIAYASITDASAKMPAPTAQP